MPLSSITVTYIRELPNASSFGCTLKSPPEDVTDTRSSSILIPDRNNSSIDVISSSHLDVTGIINPPSSSSISKSSS